MTNQNYNSSQKLSNGEEEFEEPLVSQTIQSLNVIKNKTLQKYIPQLKRVPYIPSSNYIRSLSPQAEMLKKQNQNAFFGDGPEGVDALSLSMNNVNNVSQKLDFLSLLEKSNSRIMKHPKEQVMLNKYDWKRSDKDNNSNQKAKKRRVHSKERQQDQDVSMGHILDEDLSFEEEFRNDEQRQQKNEQFENRILEDINLDLPPMETKQGGE